MVSNSLVLYTFLSHNSCNGRILFSQLCMTDLLTEMTQVFSSEILDIMYVVRGGEGRGEQGGGAQCQSSGIKGSWMLVNLSPKYLVKFLKCENYSVKLRKCMVYLP
eukprot:sb/3477880/